MKSEFPIRLTERAASAIRATLNATPGHWPNVYLHVSMDSGIPRLNLQLEVDSAADVIGESLGQKIAVPSQDCAALEGYVVDYRSIGPETGFVLKDPGSRHSVASHPGRFELSEDRLRRLQPDLFVERSQILHEEAHSAFEEFRESLAEHLRVGDSRAAVVMSVTPLIVAAYTDEIDCVALLQFPQQLTSEYGLEVGGRLLTVNMYRPVGIDSRPADLLPGPRNSGQYVNFTPLIAEFLVADLESVERRKESISEMEWERAAELGRGSLARGIAPRDGRPLYCNQPARQMS